MQPSQETNQKKNNNNNTNTEDRPGTPPRPPYSPVTPVLTQLAPVPGMTTSIVPPGPGSYSSPSPTTPYYPPQYGATTAPHTAAQPSPPIFAPEPAPVPISESDNPDAIALRSTISILQMQKQQSIRDIQTLDRMKRAAAEDPEGFVKELAAGNLTTKDKGSLIEFSDERDGGAEDGPEGSESGKSSRFGKIPNPQNVVRMPPINWAKYQIVGEPLDKMHEEQLHRPAPGEPRREEPAQRAPEHLLASPYRPLVDKLDTPAKAKGTNKGRKT